MSYKDRLKKQEKQFERILTYAPSGAGKTHFQTHLFKAPLFIDTDNSITGKFNAMPHVTKINDIVGFTDLHNNLKDIIADEDCEFDAINIDIDHAITLIADYFKRGNKWVSMDAINYDGCWKIVDEFLDSTFLPLLEKLNAKMHISLTSHATERYVADIKEDNKVLKVCPNLHNSMQVKLTDKIIAWCSSVFYIHTVSEGSMKQMGFKRKYNKFVRNGKTTRLIETSENPYYEAKNRCNLEPTMDFEEDFDFDKFREALFGGKTMKSNLEFSEEESEKQESNGNSALTEEEKKEILDQESKQTGETK